jgi:hypothetical protein
MDTRAWGPSMWTSMFMIATNYPEKIDDSNKEHLSLKKHYQSFYTNLKHMLPCRFCRESYIGFLKKLPVEDYLKSRRDIMLWCYRMKDLVNKKLINQEILTLELEIEKLKNQGGLTKAKLIELQKKTLYTIPSPPFKEIYNHYMSFKAKSCSSITKKCI